VTPEPLDPLSIEYHKNSRSLTGHYADAAELESPTGADDTRYDAQRPEAKQLLTFLKANPDFSGPISGQLQEVR